MKVILSKDVPNLGEEGDIKDVARGYARNYLIPQGFVVLHTPQNLAQLASKRKAIEKRKEEKREVALGEKSRIEALNMVIEMTAGEGGRLFGSVTAATIAGELAKVGIEVERKKIELPEHTIRSIGNHIVRIKLYGNESAQLKVQVAASGKKGDAEAASAKAGASEEKAEREASVAAGPAVDESTPAEGAQSEGAVDEEAAASPEQDE